MDDDKFLLLRNYDLWCNLSDEEYEELKVVHHYLEARKGEYIYFEPAHLSKLFFIKEGIIKIGFISEDGTEVIKEIISKGEVFGQFTLEKNNLHGEFAQAFKSDVSLCSFSVEEFEKMLQKKPLLAIGYSRKVGNKLRQTEFRLLNILNKDVRTRLLAFLYQFALQQGCKETDEFFTINNFLTHEDIARLIGSARQTVTTILNQLEEEGLLRINRKKIIIHVKEFQKHQHVI